MLHEIEVTTGPHNVYCIMFIFCSSTLALLSGVRTTLVGLGHFCVEKNPTKLETKVRTM
jgi:hypothetical protein